MKRIFTLLALIGLFISASAQTSRLVTLSHNGELTFFDKLSALEDALEAAVDGDKIFLSSGKFGSSTGISINKKISIIGNGYDSHILPSVQLALVGETIEYGAPLLEGVYIERLDLLSGVGVNPLEIKTCKIDEIHCYSLDNLLFDRCFIGYYNGGIKNISFRNSKIKSFSGSNNEYVENCNIGVFNSNPYYAASCIINHFNGSNTYGVGRFENCLIRNNAMVELSNVTFNCYVYSNSNIPDFLDDNLENNDNYAYYEQQSDKPFLGTDETRVGVYGGQWYPFTTTPTLPTVDASKSSVKYDADNHQLKVSITVAE